MNTPTPNDLWLIRRVQVGHELNGEIAFASPGYAQFIAMIGELPPEHLDTALKAFLCNHPDPGSFIKALAEADPTAARPAVDAATPQRSAHLGDLVACDATGRFVWKNHIVRSHFNLLSSNPKVGKTHVMLDIARRIWLALCWPDGQEATFPAGTPTLWVCGDRHQDELRERAAAFGLPPEAVRLNARPEEPYAGWNLDDERNIDLMRAIIDGEHPALVIIDTVWRSTRRKLRVEEEVNALFGPIIGIAQATDTAFVGLMHLSKDGETLGRRLEGMARSVMKLHRPDPENQPDRRKLVVMGNFKEPAPLGVTMGDSGCEYDHAPPEEPAPSHGGRPPEKRQKARQFIVEALGKQNDQQATVLCAVWESQGESHNAFWGARDELVKAGELTCEGKPLVMHLSATIRA